MESGYVGGIVKIVEEIRVCIDWLIKLPRRILSEVEEYSRVNHDRKSRIALQILIVKYGEFGKMLQELYFFKGDIVSWGREIVEKYPNNRDEIGYLREIIKDVIFQLNCIRDSLPELEISRPNLVFDSVVFINKLIRCYERYLDFSDDELSCHGEIESLIKDIDGFMSEASVFIEELRSIRMVLDHTYGR